MNQQDFLVEKVNLAIAGGSTLSIEGGNSKEFYGYPARGEPLDVSGHRGIVEYDPGELVITCRAGSLLSEIRETLEENGQHFPFEPPGFGASATIGGTVACGFSGPRRPWSGSLRDYLLGVKLVNGSGAVVQFGGQVMKNVAGYDVSRLMAGSMGTLGLLLEVSFKVLPRPARELTLEFECDQAEAIRRVNRWAGLPLPLSGASWWKGQLGIRLSGAETETESAARRMQATLVSEDASSWADLREQRSAFFARSGKLWRLSVPPATKPLELDGDCLVDWGGAQRWYFTDQPTDRIRSIATGANGHATLFKGESGDERFHPLPPALRQMQQKIKQAMDPHGVFDMHRMGRDD